MADFGDILWLRFPLETLVLAGVLLVSKSLKEASFLGAVFLIGLAALEAMWQWVSTLNATLSSRKPLAPKQLHKARRGL